jgi:hypothetical protein
MVAIFAYQDATPRAQLHDCATYLFEPSSPHDSSDTVLVLQ